MCGMANRLIRSHAADPLLPREAEGSFAGKAEAGRRWEGVNGQFCRRRFVP